MAKILALSFDADKTLWNPHGVYRQGLEVTVAAMEAEGDIKPGEITVDDLWDARAEVREQFQGQPHRMEDIRERSFALALERVGHSDPTGAAAELIDLYLKVRFDVVELYSEVAAVLERLKSRYKIGLLTNGNTYPDRCGLPGMFDAEVFCSEYGLAKPAVRAFEIIAEQLGVTADQMVHIGDDWDDVAGANEFGATSVFINRVDPMATVGLRPVWASDADHEVADLVEFEQLLAQR